MSLPESSRRQMACLLWHNSQKECTFVESARVSAQESIDLVVVVAEREQHYQCGTVGLSNHTSDTCFVILHVVLMESW